MPTSLRKLTVAGIAGVAVALAFSAPASACHAEPAKTAVCIDNQTAKVTWDVKAVGWTPNVSSVTAYIGTEKAELDSTSTLKAGVALNGTLKAVLVVPRDKGTELGAKLVVVLTGKDQANQDKTWSSENDTDNPKKADFTTKLRTINWAECPAPSKSPSSSAPTSASTSGVAAVTSSSSAAALPVTGANVALMAGSAVVLVGAGVGLFLVARRRRVRFTTS